MDQPLLGDANLKGSNKRIPTAPNSAFSMAPRACCSQRNHRVTDCSGSVQPDGHPIIQSLKAGLEPRCPSECFSPLCKITRHRWEEAGRLTKEDLLRFDGRPLFPERRAYTVKYEHSPEEAALAVRLSSGSCRIETCWY